MGCLINHTTFIWTPDVCVNLPLCDTNRNIIVFGKQYTIIDIIDILIDSNNNSTQYNTITIKSTHILMIGMEI